MIKKLPCGCELQVPVGNEKPAPSMIYKHCAEASWIVNNLHLVRKQLTRRGRASDIIRYANLESALRRHLK